MFCTIPRLFIYPFNSVIAESMSVIKLLKFAAVALVEIVNSPLTFGSEPLFIAEIVIFVWSVPALPSLNNCPVLTAGKLTVLVSLVPSPV